MMIEKGIIRRFTVELCDTQNSDALHEKAIFDIKLTKSARRLIYQIIRTWPELVSCYSLAGEVDMTVIIQARETAKVEELREKIAQMACVQNIQTRAILRRWDMPG